jgi:UDP-N-acetylmuramoyl-tripeptide--D-alanyl-D-alanine ligase
VQNSLAALLAARLVGADLALAALAFADFAAPAGRGERLVLATPSGEAVLLDESYNANPASMAAALALLRATRVFGRGRRIAVLGDMLELGSREEELHRGLAEPIEAAGVDLVFAAGPRMRALYDALPEARRGAWAPTAAELEPRVVAAVRGGDAIVVKGSAGSRMAPIVAALSNRFAPGRRAEALYA